MIRTFTTHRVRPQRELSGALWDFSPCQGDLAGSHRKTAVPGCWENLPEFGSYRGEALYETKFSAEGNIRLEFKGVSHTAEVYLDGQEIGKHYNAYTPFSFVVRDLKRGVHTLTVKADNRFSEASALHVPNDYMSYGGISRAVVLEEIGDLFIDRIQTKPFRENGEWKLQTKVYITNLSEKSTEADIRFALTEARAEGISRAGEPGVKASFIAEGQSIPAGGMIILEASLSCPGVIPWSPEHPVLYLATAVISREGTDIDDLTDRTGFREVKMQGRQILLNGRPLRIKGFCRHEDHPQFGCALPYSAIAADLRDILYLGANSVRTSHYPNDEIFLDLCDELGILVWEENHARGLSEEDMRNPHFKEQAEMVTKEMITAHFNHPCIYIWGIMNECASETEYGRECYSRQFDLIRRLDESRPCSFASCKFKTDLCLDLPDVVSYNIYPQWYHDAPVDEYLSDLYDWVQGKTGGAGKPFLVTETGAGAVYGYRAPYRPKWSEEYQADALEKQIKAVMSQPGCSGMYIWQFCDVRVSDEWFAGRPRTMNNKGIVDEYRRRKLSYDVVKRLYESYGNYFDE